MTITNIGTPEHIAAAICSGFDPSDPSIPDWALQIWQAGRMTGLAERQGVTR